MSDDRSRCAPCKKCGVLVIDGNRAAATQLACVAEDSDVTTAIKGRSDLTIATQCCVKGDGAPKTACRRYVGNSRTGCVSGHAKLGRVAPKTFREAEVSK